MNRKRNRTLWLILAGVVLCGAVALDFVQAEIRKSAPAVERAAAAERMRTIMKEAGSFENLTPEQWVEVQAFINKQRLPTAEELKSAPKGQMPPTNRMRSIWKRTKGDWKKLTAEEREFLKSQLPQDVFKKNQAPKQGGGPAPLPPAAADPPY
jgi:hypothetical protein